MGRRSNTSNMKWNNLGQSNKKFKNFFDCNKIFKPITKFQNFPNVSRTSL